MPDAGRLAETFLDQCPACHWLVRSERAAPQKRKPRTAAAHLYQEIFFERIWGDSTALFGAPAADLLPGASLNLLQKDMLRSWQGRFERAFDGETLMLRER